MVKVRALDERRQDAGAGPSSSLGNVIDAILEALAIEDVRRVLDVGCGRGGLAAALVRRGYAVTGIDPQQDAVDTARRRAPGAIFYCATAEAIPVKDMSFGAVVMQNALHHIPGALMRPALKEARRVLQHQGVLVVLEPLAEGSFFEAMRPVDDETAVRAQALAALSDFEAQTGWERIHDDVIDRVSSFEEIDGFLSYLHEADPARADAITARRHEVSSAFSRVAEPRDGVLLLRQPHLLRVLRKTKG